MNGRTLLAAFLACLVASAFAVSAPVKDSVAASPAGTEATLQSDTVPTLALDALEAEREQAIAAFDWGERAEFGTRLVAYNTLLKDFDRRELALREDALRAAGRLDDAERLRAERLRQELPRAAQPETTTDDRSAPAPGTPGEEVQR